MTTDRVVGKDCEANSLGLAMGGGGEVVRVRLAWVEDDWILDLALIRLDCWRGSWSVRLVWEEKLGLGLAG